jgi:hypothetical protein
MFLSKTTLQLIIVVATIVIISSCSSGKLSQISDNFESDSLSENWSADKFIPGALEIQSAYVRSGEKAAKLILHQGDQIEEEVGTNLERAELREPKKFMAVEHKNYSYSFSIFLPADFPIVPTRLVVAQWKQNCQSGNCDPDNPVIALRYESGEFRITLQSGPNKMTLYSLKDEIRNKWIDFKFNIRFSRNEDGQIMALLNKNEIINFKGVTAYTHAYGYPDPGNFYFKIGLYRDQMVQPMTIYIDNYVKQEIKGF